MSVTDLRLQLAANGYAVIPNRDKRTFTKSWPKLAQDEETIRSWGKRRRDQATGIRVENGLAVIDIDIEDDNTVEAILTVWESQLDLSTVPMRGNSKNGKLALFVRTTEKFNRLHTGRWALPSADPDDPTACIEIFGGGSARQFGAYGPHTVDERGEVLVEYEWLDGPAPDDTPIGELPALDKQQFFDLLNLATEEIQRHGYEPVPSTLLGEDFVQRVYDLTPDMRFDCNDGVTRSLDELRSAARADHNLRCSASWLEPAARRTDRCLVNLDHSGGVAIWETSTGVSHHEVDREPRDHQAELSAKLAAKLPAREGGADPRGDGGGAADRDRAGGDSRGDKRTAGAEGGRALRGAPSLPTPLPKEPPVIKDSDDMSTVAAKLIDLYAFCPTRQLSVVPIWAADPERGMSLTNFRLSMAKHHEVEIGPRGGERKVNPVDVWLNSKNHIEIAGVRLRPDMPRPIYEEGGELFVNSYRPPVHVGGGDTSVFWAFLERLLPIEEERAWFTDWMTCKFQHPEIPGPAVIMVTRTQGTGRGLLFEILAALFGDQYVSGITFDDLTGKTYQSQYNEWQSNSLIITVDETHSPEDSTYRGRKAAYEHLKQLVDPRATKRMIRVKGDRNFHTRVFTSYLIASNNLDGVPLEDGDRRFGVLSNGDEVLPSDHPIHAWLANGGVAGLARELAERSFGDYDPYAPPLHTMSKDTMQAENQTDLDMLFETVMENLQGEIYTPAQIVHRLGGLIRGHHDLPQQWRGLAQRKARGEGHRLAKKDGPGWVVKIDGVKYPAYAKTRQLALKWGNIEDRRQEMLKNGHPDPQARLKALDDTAS